MPHNSQHDLRLTTGRHQRYDLTHFYILQQLPLELQMRVWRFCIQNHTTSLGQYADYSMTRRFNLQGVPAGRRRGIQLAGLGITPVFMNIMMQNRIARQVALECWIEWIKGCFREGHNGRGLILRPAPNRNVARLLADLREMLTRLIGGGGGSVMEAEGG